MELKFNFTVDLPEDVATVLGIDEDTLFEAFYENGKIVIRPLSDEDVCDGCCESCPFSDIECDYDCDGCPCVFCEEREDF